VEQATQLGRIIIPKATTAEPGGPRNQATEAASGIEPKWRGVAILYAKEGDDGIELRLFYEGHISQRVKDEIAERFGVGAIEWNMEAD
jgi:hypothetical protein